MITARTVGYVRLLGIALVLGLVLSSGVGQAREPGGTYANPVSEDFADTFADPSIIKAKDGYWYSFGTSDPLREGEGKDHVIPISRSKDLVNWKYVGDAFGRANRPSWATSDAGIWAPDIRYLNGKYYLYYVVTETTVTPEPDDNAIGVATAPTPAGPWKDSGKPVVGPRRGNGGFLWTFDPNEFTDSDGKRYLYYGSYNGGVFVKELTRDGKRTVGRPTMVGIDNRYEGTYVVKREGFYYLFGSSANCCAGPTTGYSVYVGRSRSPEGPFRDREGRSMTESRVGGSIVVTPNGNKWIGPGHNAVVTDLSGEDYFVYHAIDRRDPYLDEPYGINERPMLIDRLDWIDGWPTVRGDEWASQSAQRAPITDGPVNASFNRPGSLDRNWDSDGGDWRRVEGPEGEGFVRQEDGSESKAFLTNRNAVPDDARVEGDLRFGAGGRSAGIVVRYENAKNYAVAWLDRTEGALVTDAIVAGESTGQKRARLPASFAFGEWHNLAVEVRGQKMTAEVTDARLHDPYAVAARDLPRGLSGNRVGLFARGGAEADNLSAARLYRPNNRLAPKPGKGGISETHSDEFDGGALEEEWSWVREPDGEQSGGAYRWPVQEADIVGGEADNSASLLLRDAPKGNYTVETRLTIDLGVQAVRNFQQGGLIAYLNDDHWTRLSHVAIFNTRQTEFGKEMPFAGNLSFGGMLVGPPSETTYLRLAHRVDPQNSEHEFRAATKRQGGVWIQGGTWTLPAGTEPRIGLLSLGKQEDGESSTSEFEYFRVYRP